MENRFSLVEASLVLFATSCLRTYFPLTVVAARLSKYLSRAFVSPFSMP